MNVVDMFSFYFLHSNVYRVVVFVDHLLSQVLKPSTPLDLLKLTGDIPGWNNLFPGIFPVVYFTGVESTGSLSRDVFRKILC